MPDQTPDAFSVRVAADADADAIAEIYNESTADRVATFETRLRDSCEVLA